MKFKMPVASRERMGELLEYLGDTSNYSKYYEGNRAEDFKKCFDIESEWCWKYADLMLRGMENRELEYGEMHHVVPYAYYKQNLPYCTRKFRGANASNETVLSFSEHLYAHYCVANCCNSNIKNAMFMAFCLMWNKSIQIQLPTEMTVRELIEVKEYERIRAVNPRVIGVEKSGRKHLWEVSKAEFDSEYYEANRDKILARAKEYRNNNKEKIRIRDKKYREGNKERVKAKQKVWCTENKEHVAAKKKEWRTENKEHVAAKKKEYRETHKEELYIYFKEYNEKNRDRLYEQHKIYREKNKDAIANKKKKIYEEKKSSGYRYRFDKVSGKHKWVFVGLPKQEEAA